MEPGWLFGKFSLHRLDNVTMSRLSVIGHKVEGPSQVDGSACG